MRARRHFAQFDDELQDSDQTISTPARHLRPRARLPTVADDSSSGGVRPRRRFPTSAFFSDTTDDDASRPTMRPSGRSQLSMSAYSRRTEPQQSKSPLHMSAGPAEGRRRGATHLPRIHVDAIQFPATRSVLWDRRRLSGEPIGVSLEQVLPRFILSADALKEIYRLFGEKTGVRGNEAPLCFLYGDATRTKKVFLEGVKMKKEDARAAGAWCIPVYSIAGGSKPGLTQESYAATIAAVQSSYRDEYADDIASKLQPKLLVFRSSPHEAQLDFQMECAASPVLFKFSLVRNLPLLMTPLAASLARREFSTRSVSLRSGYLTLDRTRKAVPLLKVDPLVLQQLLVGVWVYGIQIDDAWDEEVARRQLADPFLYFACIGYLMSEAIRERVGPEKNTFLVALYPASDPSNNSAVGSLPRFFECSFSEFLSSARPLPMELYSNRRSCLVGMSKFSTDVELTLSAAPTNEWEAARRQAKIPTAPRIDEPQHLDASETQVLASNNERGHSEGIPPDSNDQDEDEELTSGWTITDAAIRKSVAQATSMQSQPLTYTKEQADIPVTRAEADTEKAEEKPAIPPSDDDLHDATCAHAVKESSGLNPPNEAEDISGLRQRDWTGNNSSSYRSCCKTQQLLTIQHQQILENQQRQLHEMQEQITQLRRLLEAARNANKKDAHPTPNDEVYDSDASSSSIGAVADVSNVSSTFSRHGNDRQSSQSSRVSSARRRTDDGPFSDKSSNHTHQESNDGGENEDKDVSLSSLGLSSISSGSMDADLSSLSSSIVSERPKLFTCSQSHDANQSEIGAKVEDVGQSRLSEASADAGQQHVNAEANDDIEVDLSDKSAKQGLVGSTEGADAHNLSIGDLSTNLSEEATAVADKASVTFASNENGDSCDAEGVSGDDRAVVERLLPPDAYLRKVGGFVDHHGGCFTTPPLDFHSFCVPRIKFSSEGPECSLSDSDDEEIRLIEQKYKRLMAA